MGISGMWKAVVAGVTGIALLATDILADDVFTLDEGTSLLTKVIVTVVGVWSVWRVRNATPVESRQGM